MASSHAPGVAAASHSGGRGADMDPDTRENWRKIRDHLEAVGKTDNHYYRRAVAILQGKPDPFDRYSGFEPGAAGERRN